MTRVWRGSDSDSDSIPNPKFELGSFRGPRNQIRFGSGTHCKSLRDRVMRGLGYGSHIERSVVSSRLTYLPPVS